MERLLRVELPVDPVSASAARMLVGEAVGDLPPDRLGEVALLTHELVMNGVRHGSAGSSDAAVELTVERGDGQLRVEVVDCGEGFASASRPSGGGSRLGLRMVAEIADHWGITRTDRTRVWFEMTLPPEA